MYFIGILAPVAPNSRQPLIYKALTWGQRFFGGPNDHFLHSTVPVFATIPPLDKYGYTRGVMCDYLQACKR